MAVAQACVRDCASVPLPLCHYRYAITNPLHQASKILLRRSCTELKQVRLGGFPHKAECESFTSTSADVMDLRYQSCTVSNLIFPCRAQLDSAGCQERVEPGKNPCKPVWISHSSNCSRRHLAADQAFDTL